MRNKLLTTALLIAIPLFVTACSHQDLPVIGQFFSRPIGPVSLNWWGLWESPETMQAVIQQYQEQNPNVTINYEDRSVMELFDYKERAFSRILQEEDAPDIVRVHISWVPRLVSGLEPMPSGLMSAEEYSSKFYPVMTENAVINGDIYAVPLNYDGLVLVYNEDHFDEIGQTNPPTAWEEFRRLALELSIRGGDRNENLIRAGAAVGTSNNIDHFSDIIGLMWSQAGVDIPDDVDSKAAQDALTFYTNFVEEDRVWSEDFPEATAAFVNGQVSMIFVPSWQLLDILEIAPDMDIGVASVPQALPSQPASWANFWVEVVPKGAGNPRAAWDFLNFLSQEDQQILMFSEASRERPFGSAFGLATLASEISDTAYIGPVVRTAPNAKTGEIAARAGNERQVEALGTAIDQVLNGQNVAEALEAVKTELER